METSLPTNNLIPQPPVASQKTSKLVFDRNYRLY